MTITADIAFGAKHMGGERHTKTVSFHFVFVSFRFRFVSNDTKRNETKEPCLRDTRP